MVSDVSYLEPYNRHRNVVPVNYITPNISSDSFISPNSMVSGSSFVDSHSSIWYGSVLDGAHRPIKYFLKN